VTHAALLDRRLGFRGAAIHFAREEPRAFDCGAGAIATISARVIGNYPKTKASAEQRALAASGPGLEVVVVRPRCAPLCCSFGQEVTVDAKARTELGYLGSKSREQGLSELQA
jgi:hypothetical protein